MDLIKHVHVRKSIKSFSEAEEMMQQRFNLDI